MYDFCGFFYFFSKLKILNGFLSTNFDYFYNSFTKNSKVLNLFFLKNINLPIKKNNFFFFSYIDNLKI